MARKAKSRSSEQPQGSPGTTPGTSPGTAPRTASRSGTWLQGAGAGAVVVLLPGAALLAGVMLCPVIAFWALTGPTERPAARAMLLFALAASVPTASAVWTEGVTLAAALDLLADPSRPLLAWAAAGTGWLIGEVTSVLTRLLLIARLRRRIEALRREAAELRVEWGLEGGSKLA